MKSVLPNKLVLGWIPVRDKQHYPLMGIHPVFFQNTMELFFLVGFVAYLHWSSVLVVLYCIAESLVITLFNAYKAQKSFVFSQRKKQSLIIFSLVLGSIFIAFQFLVLGHLYPQRITLQAISSLIWNDNEFLLCLLAIVLQQAIEYYKHSKTAMVFSEDLFQTLTLPSVKLAIQQILLIGVLLFFLFTPNSIQLLAQAIVLSLVWVLVKLVLGQVSCQWSGISGQEKSKK